MAHATTDILKSSELLDDEGIRAADLARHEAATRASVDPMSSETRKERDRLLLASLLSVLFASADKLPSQVSWQNFNFNLDARLVAGAVEFGLLYFLLSFWVMARTDRLKWRSIQALAISDLANWGTRLKKDVDRVFDSANSLGNDMQRTFDEYRNQQMEHELALTAIRGSRDHATWTSTHYPWETDPAIEAEEERFASLRKQYDLRPLGEEIDRQLERHGPPLEALKRTSEEILLWKRLGIAHIRLSMIMPIAIAAGAGILLGAKLVAAWT